MPFFSGAPTTYLTAWAYDRLNRPVQKLGQGAEMDSHGNTQTDYSYTGRTTKLTVHPTGIAAPNGICPTHLSPANLCMTMSRSKNVLGQWMQTSDAMAGVTNTWTEPQGHVVAMEDPESNFLRAAYNDVGQRTQSSDPDQGVWNFTYDGLGESYKQTDPRGVVTQVTGRDALGRMTEQQQTLPASVPASLANQTLRDNWSYDPVNGIGEIGTVARRRNTGVAVPPLANTPVWSEATAYDAEARPITLTTAIDEVSPLTPMVSQMAYDADGRLSTHTYPSGLVVKNIYGTYGQLQSLTNNGSTTYWTATAENEWGHVTGETLPDGLSGSHQDYDSTGQSNSLSWASSTTADKFVSNYDSFGNVVQQQRTASGANNTEDYFYDPLQRLTMASRALSGNPVQYAYSASGNLTYKNDYSIQTAGAYTYGTAVGTGGACGPHAATSVALPGGQFATYNCDASGNVVGGNTLTAVYDADNHPTTITRTFASVPIETCRKGDTIFCDGFEHLAVTSGGSGSATWAYDSNGQRDYETSSQQGTRYYGPNGYELLSTGVAKHELGPVIVSRMGTTDSITVVLHDRMGSTLDTIDGSTVARRSYDAFGKTRNGNMSDRPNGTLNLEPDTIHGFTSHTHEDDVALIHMNGRVYDYTLARFLNVDPVIQNPLSSQGLNPYSYIGNNPLSGKDPTGYCTGSLFDNGGCSSATFSLTQVGTPSVTEQNAIDAARAAGANTSGSGGPVSQTSGGAGGIKNAQSSTPDQMALGNAPSVQNGQPPVTKKPDEDNGDVPTLSTVPVTAKAGAYLNSDEEATVRQLSFNDVQAGKDQGNETMVFINNKGKVLDRTQSGCHGADDICRGDPPSGTAVAGHSHIYPALPTGLDAQTKKVKEMSRDMPGFGDAGSLSQGVPGVVWTRGGYKYAIEGTYQNPEVRYLEGGQADFGHYVEQHWEPHDNSLLFKIVTDYLQENPR